jgi:1,2-diacylglycerol 3-alpha-glucosyltransferase
LPSGVKVKKLTIGIFMEHYDPFMSGVISSVKSLRGELQTQGHRVYIVCPKAGKYKDSDPDIIRIPSFSTKSLENTTIGLPNPLSNHKLNKISFDLIHSQEVFFTSVLGMQIARSQQIPYIQTYHTLWDKFLEQYQMDKRVIFFGAFSITIFYPFVFGLSNFAQLFRADARTTSESKFTSRIMWRHMLIMAKTADYAIVPSEHLKMAIANCGIKTPISTVPNSIHPLDLSKVGSALPAKSRKLRVLCVARLSPEKRIQTLLKAVSLLPESDLELIIIGEGPCEQQLKETMKKLKIENRVIFMGPLSNDQTRRAMLDADVLALASYDFDNQPMVFNEAFDAGLPIIYCDPRLGEGLNTDNSLLVDKSAQAFSEGFTILKSNQLRQKMSTAAKEATTMHNSKQVAAQTLKIYESVLRDFKNH